MKELNGHKQRQISNGLSLESTNLELVIIEEQPTLFLCSKKPIC